MPKLKKCKFYEVTKLVPKTWAPWFWASISESAPFTWGDCCHSLIPLRWFYDHAFDVVEGMSDSERGGVKVKAVKAWYKRLQKLGSEAYVDMEN